jgi:hypothetical protein
MEINKNWIEFLLGLLRLGSSEPVGLSFHVLFRAVRFLVYFVTSAALRIKLSVWRMDEVLLFAPLVNPSLAHLSDNSLRQIMNPSTQMQTLLSDRSTDVSRRSLVWESLPVFSAHLTDCWCLFARTSDTISVIQEEGEKWPTCQLSYPDGTIRSAVMRRRETWRRCARLFKHLFL